MRCSLPMEIIEHVVDMLHLDVRVLRILSLTCRDLLPRSRFHLFYSIKFVPILREVDALCSFLDGSPELADQVHIVTVRPDPRPAAGMFLAGLLRKLPRLRHCKLLVGGTPSGRCPCPFIRAPLHSLGRPSISRSWTFTASTSPPAPRLRDSYARFPFSDISDAPISVLEILVSGGLSFVVVYNVGYAVYR
ncbi:hypothetical protein DICSQDRAFT_62682 [Dichomitus squalens LYAD-421 SS1]|uniref:F-box domain-containing protein n=1 Tax=Dichomitus squalens (strain LYAD-421) TaxID=732165 RepID=R7SWZ3_DICSQ|nr:uncharacterized protein DICSQDRAFT_62682 [Dichomitus squalens LYAD-421 SS1]EJF60611.1 hypothetical protein DICSQDRAFT_62682 [Dichomitus squalens LYAD-421 SS1]